MSHRGHDTQQELQYENEQEEQHERKGITMANYNLKESTDHYDRLMELFEVARQEVSEEKYDEIRHEWFECGEDNEKCPTGILGGVVKDSDERGQWTALASWHDIETFVGWLQDYDIDKSIIGEVFGVDPSQERWLFN